MSSIKAEVSEPVVPEEKSGPTEPPPPPPQNDDDEDDLFGDSEEVEEKPVKTEDPESSEGVENSATVDVQHSHLQSSPSAPAANPPKDEPAAPPSVATSEPKKEDQAKLEKAEVVVKVEEGAKSGDNSTFSIPKKTKASPKPLKEDTTKSAATKAFMRGSIFGLSDDVQIPTSVDTKLLEGGILSKLKALPPNLANDALQEFDDALQIKGQSIRNRGAYLYGVIKRYTSVHDRATTGGEGSGILPMGEGLTPAVNAKLEALVVSGFCSREEMNEKVKSKIRMLSEKDALFAVDELASTDRKSIRNFGSFFMGILNRYMRGDTQSRHDSAHSHPSSSSSRNNRFDRQSFNGRDRSRDGRVPQNRRDSGGRNNHQHQQMPGYDPRHQRPAWQQGLPPPSQPSMGYNGPGYAPPGPYPQQNQFVQPGNTYQPPGMPPPQNQFVPQGGGYRSPGIPPPPPHQGPPPGYGQPQQPMMGQQQPFNMGNPSFQQQQQNSGWARQQPAHSQPPPARQGQMLDIMALADKASSAVQALNNPTAVPPQPPPFFQNQYQQPRQSSLPPPQFQQQQAPYQHPPPPVPQSHGSAQQRPANQASHTRHTTAKIEMLSPQVQYAVQNLIASGQVERAPDEGILGMIYDLPEGLALASLQKFCTIDKSSMRSRIAYLAGVLRRELEKINRR